MKYLIQGNKPLNGKIKASGSKNSALPIIAASLLLKNKIILYNIPDIKDVNIMLQIANSLGSKIRFNDNTLEIIPDITNNLSQKQFCCKIRASLYFLAPLLQKYNKIALDRPGGCVLGERPINYHLEILKQFGAKISEKGSRIIVEKVQLKGANLFLPYPSVGATINAILLSLIANSSSSISNYAKEPEILDLINFLKKAGADIFLNDNAIIIHPLNHALKTIEYTVISDRIETFTFLIASAITNGNITINNCNPEHLFFPSSVLKQIGLNPVIKSNSISLNCSNIDFNDLSPINISTAPYPEFPTDLQPIITPLLAKLNKPSTITETVFQERFAHLPEFSKFNIKTSLNFNTLKVYPSIFQPADVSCSDMRAGASLALAALASSGNSKIKNIEQIQRGYENFHKKLSLLGAMISLI